MSTFEVIGSLAIAVLLYSGVLIWWSKTARRDIKIHIDQCWETEIVRGTKTIEGRLRRGKFVDVREGDLLVAARRMPVGGHVLTLKVKRVQKYESFKALLTDEGIEDVLPGIGSVAEGVAEYNRFYSPDEEQKHGVIAMEVEILGRAWIWKAAP